SEVFPQAGRPTRLATTTRSGRSCFTRSRTSFTQPTQRREPASVSKAGTVKDDAQLEVRYVVTRQCRREAISSKAGTHWAAWELPINTTRVFPCGSPNAQAMTGKRLCLDKQSSPFDCAS